MCVNQIVLSSMQIRNFKGIKDFTLDINGDASIYGENGTGKTTIADAFQWVLFGKDSANRSDFSVKPQDEDGNDIHFLETEVTLELLINGQLKTLRKRLEEVWAKKRGEANKEFTGHQTSYWVDAVPAKAKEYQAEINAIINETAFKLLTNPFFFCTQLKWEERRKTLVQICGDVSDADVIASDMSLYALTDILAGRSIDNQKKIIAEKIKMLNKNIADIPVRISEQSRKLTTNEDIDYDFTEAELFKCKTSLNAIEQHMTDASQLASVYHQKQQDAYKLTEAMEERKKELDEGAMAGLKRATDEKVKLEGAKYQLSNDIKTTDARIKDKEKLIAECDADLVKLRATWNDEAIRQFVEPDPDVFICPTCEQRLPEEQKDSKITQMRANFGMTKDEILANINAAGKGIKAKQALIMDELEVLKNDLMNHEMNLLDIADRLVELDKELEAERQRTFGADYESDTKYSDLNTQLQAIKAELNKPVEDTTTELLQRKKEVTEQIDSLNKILNNRDVATKTKERIEELKDEERLLASQLSEFEKQKYLIEQFIKAKVNLLESNINSRFKLVKWKLFKTNINGGIEEMCEAMVDGVEFNSNLNHAARVNAGLDIINVLAEHYGCTAPIFIDFRESVSRIIETKSQVINLIKSEPDKVLRVEAAV